MAQQTAAAGAAAGNGVRGVKSAARTVEVLEVLAARGNEPVTVRELCDAMEAPRSSVYALLRTLTELGWVRSDSTHSLYSIGIRALLAGTTYLDTDPLLQVVQPHVDQVSRQLEETVHYGRLDRTDIVYLATHQSAAYERARNRVGRRLPAYSTSLGKAVLAHFDDQELEAHLPPVLTPLTPTTITSREALREDLAVTRERGYAIDDEENTPGLRCFGVALPIRSGITDALSCSVPLDRLTPEHEREIIAALRSTADVTLQIVRGLGGLLG
ncbi:helix-turn-helix domain-containing protein [Kocuria sediminis]|uniref:Glycerol operon regulatory protein n=1 Tax=Kocuria sediminis TaxID=1038857 RepID=A0A6N8GQV3_9MICC|nr:IclR family transcriptional regulator [Kocuria sediminis]MUN64650.1 helix-turn-helix domain-containing protein [Kocuria sediminis]